jgi:cell division protein FtsX
MDLPKIYNIKLEDKAAFINKAERMGMTIDTFDIKDNKINDTFSITLNTPQDVEIVKAVLKSSPKINDVNISEIISKEIKQQIQEYLEK